MNEGGDRHVPKGGAAHRDGADQVQKAARVGQARHRRSISRGNLASSRGRSCRVRSTTSRTSASALSPEGAVPKATFREQDRKPVGWRGGSRSADGGRRSDQGLRQVERGRRLWPRSREAEREQPVEVRAGSFNALRIYLNGKEIYFRNEYHHGMTMDQHIGKGTLKAGRNEVLIKVCQNEQTEPWAQSWSFQLRLSDALGGPAEVRHVGGKK
ncbi:MAG: hypothetical protein U0793_21345 [Gemmataceae bacterium]